MVDVSCESVRKGEFWERYLYGDDLGILEDTKDDLRVIIMCGGETCALRKAEQNLLEIAKNDNVKMDDGNKED